MQAKLKSNKFLLYALVLALSGLAGYSFFAAFDRVPAKEEEKIFYSVIEVIDGDTIKSKVSGKVENIRLIGIDAPETAGPYREEECFGQEASSKIKELLAGKKVFLASDVLASDRDKYGRLLRYVFLPDGKFVNAEMIKGGYAFNYAYENFQHLNYFNNLEKQAKESRLGLWGSGCDYYFETK